MSASPSSPINSTTVRANPQAPWYLRAGMRGLGAVAPGLASAWGERIFLTAPRHRPPEREVATLASARAGEVLSEGQRLVTWTWGSGPNILLVHGWGGRGGQLHAFVAPLVDSGFTVTTFDGPGHGRSTGRTSSLVEHGRAVHAVARATGGLHAVITHSMGGASTTFAFTRGLLAERAVFIAPPARATTWSSEFARAMAMPDHVHDRMLRGIERRLSVPFRELDMALAAPGQRVPLLVVHDADDKEVPIADGRHIADLWPDAVFEATTGLGHRRILEAPAVVARAVAFATGR
jgi:pimeloyl-ACP methyl ester carboxylesterase